MSQATILVGQAVSPARLTGQTKWAGETACPTKTHGETGSSIFLMARKSPDDIRSSESRRCTQECAAGVRAPRLQPARFPLQWAHEQNQPSLSGCGDVRHTARQRE